MYTDLFTSIFSGNASSKSFVFASVFCVLLVSGRVLVADEFNIDI